MCQRDLPETPVRARSVGSTGQANGGGPGLAGNLHARYLFVLFAVAALVILDQMVVQPALVRLTFYAPVINVAGRQRMLSQKLTKAALALRASESPAESHKRLEELRNAVQVWATAHQGLQHGNEDLALPGTDSPQIVAAFARLQPHFEAMRSAAVKLSQQPAHPNLKERQSETPTDGESRARGPATERDHHVRVILANESEYLPIMDAIVGMFEAEAREQLAWLRLSGLVIAAAILALLVGVWFLVLRPASRLIQRQFTQLEHAHHRLEERVEERTRQLSEANTALQREIADRHQAELRSRQLQYQLAHAARLNAMGQLATGLAHELNQPLGAVNNYAESCRVMLEQGQFTRERLSEGLARISQSVMRAGAIVRRMRNFVQPSPPDRCQIDLNHLIREVAGLLDPEVRKLSSRLELCLQDDLPKVSADIIGIQQVLVNLIQNGLQAMRCCPLERRRICVSTKREARWVTVTVADTGPGFGDKTIADLLEPFVTTKSDGLGMGLAISRTIIQEHEGELTGESPPEGGAVLRFTLPLEGETP